jgi:hypothetical protein
MLLISHIIVTIDPIFTGNRKLLVVVTAKPATKCVTPLGHSKGDFK